MRLENDGASAVPRTALAPSFSRRMRTDTAPTARPPLLPSRAPHSIDKRLPRSLLLVGLAGLLKAQAHLLQELLPVLRLAQEVRVRLQLRVDDPLHLVVAPHDLQHVGPEGALREVHHVAEQSTAKGPPVLDGAVHQGHLHHVAAVAVQSVADKARDTASGDLTHHGRGPEGLTDDMLLLRVAVLEDGLCDVVAEGVPAEILNVAQAVVHNGRGQVASAMLQEPAEDVAAEAVIYDGAGIAAELLGHEATQRRRHDLDDLLDHVVRVGRVDGLLHLAVELLDETGRLADFRNLQGKLHHTAAGLVTREAPDGAAQGLDGGGAGSLVGLQVLHEVLELQPSHA